MRWSDGVPGTHRVATIDFDGEPQWSAAHFVSGVKHLPITYTLR